MHQDKKAAKIKANLTFCLNVAQTTAAAGRNNEITTLSTKALKDMGFDNVANAQGGFDSLKKAGLPVVVKEKK